MSFSDIIKDLRSDRELTQTEVARACKVSTQCISSLEAGTRNPTGSTLSALADFYSVSVDYLLGREESETYFQSTAVSQSEEERRLINMFRNMSHPQKIRFLAFGEGLTESVSSSKKNQ